MIALWLFWKNEATLCPSIALTLKWTAGLTETLCACRPRWRPRPRPSAVEAAARHEAAELVRDSAARGDDHLALMHRGDHVAGQVPCAGVERRSGCKDSRLSPCGRSRCKGTQQRREKAEHPSKRLGAVNGDALDGVGRLRGDASRAACGLGGVLRRLAGDEPTW